MMISGVLVMTKPERLEGLRSALAELPGVEVHHEDPAGRLVITIEASSNDEAMARLREVQERPDVITAEMAEHYVEDEPDS